MSERGTGSALFASVMLMIAGTVNVIYGIAAIDGSKFYVNETNVVFENLKTWGWLTLLLGILGIIAGLSVAKGGTFGKTIGILAAGLIGIGALLSVGGEFPFWSLGVFAISIVVIRGLAAYDPQDETTTRSRTA